MKSWFVLCISCIFSVFVLAQQSNERIIKLKNGDKVTGKFISETDTTIVIVTSFGQVTVSKSDIKLREITVYLKDGNVISGGVLSQTDSEVVLQTNFGEIKIESATIDRTVEAGEKIPGQAATEEFYYSQERLVDLFFDPTGYTLEKGSVYVSGLSWGVGLTDDIDIFSSYWRYFFADLNIRPKFRIYKGGDLNDESSLSVGFHLHAAGPTMKRKFVETTYETSYWNGATYVPSVSVNSDWKSVGDFNEYIFWGEVFTGFTRSFLKQDNTGRWSYHVGGSVIFYDKEIMPRGWFAVDYDVSAQFKLIGQIYYDPFQPSYRELQKNKNFDKPVDFDFGFVYSFGEKTRFGIHFQPYIVLFYYEF